MLRINRVSIGSAFRIGAIVTVIFFVIWMAFWLLLASAIQSAFDDISDSLYDDGYYRRSSSSDINVSGALMSLLCCVPISAIAGGIMGALYAFIYNLAAGWVGGLEIEVEDMHSVMMAKYKRDQWQPPGYQDYQGPPPPGSVR